jgi:hypothetical protein
MSISSFDDFICGIVTCLCEYWKSMVNAIYGRHIGGEPANVGGPLVHARSPVVRERAIWDVEDDVGLPQLHSWHKAGSSSADLLC